MKISRSMIVILLPATLLLLSDPSSSSKAQAQYVPLSTDSLKQYWGKHPNADVDAYINDVVKRRGVGFLPYKSVRMMLHNAGVPDRVISSLRESINRDSEFRFVVWKFDSPSLPLSEQVRLQLAQSIISEYNRRFGQFQDVFPYHNKPPYSEPGKGEGPEPPVAGGKPGPPLMHLTGTIKKDGPIHKVTLQLKYTSDSEPGVLPIGEPGDVTSIRLDSTSLPNSAKQTVDKVHEMLKRELIQ